MISGKGGYIERYPLSPGDRGGWFSAAGQAGRGKGIYYFLLSLVFRYMGNPENAYL